MPKLSVIIPSRDERFLIPTIDDIFRNARGEIEVIAVLDSNTWPGDWKSVTDRHPNLHTIHNGVSRGMRHSINVGVASAISRGAKFIMKSDGHCSFSEGFDEVLKAECEPNWVVVPRRGRLDPEAWTATEIHKPDIDYHYLSFPNDPNDFGGPGLNGKVWNERAVERKGILLDEEMSSQGSCWFMHADYFNQLELMDGANWGTFWCEFQEIGLRCWLSGGRVMVNKKAKYLHLHKGKKYGRGYRLEEGQLQKGRNRAMLWPWNEEWPKQTLPFKWLIEHFWPVPTWPENWEEVLYAPRKPRTIGAMVDLGSVAADGGSDNAGTLVIHSARYGVLAADGLLEEGAIDVTGRIRWLVRKGSLDIVVNNSTVTPNQNPFRGIKKTLEVIYSYDGGRGIRIQREEKDWLIIGPVATSYQPPNDLIIDPDPKPMEGRFVEDTDFDEAKWQDVKKSEDFKPATVWVEGDDKWKKVGEFGGIDLPRTAPALNDYLIRRFQISPQRLRGPMPIELRDFHRNDLAQLFAELGFKRGAEIGVAEGRYSEVLLKANPEMELLLVDPWTDYQENPQGKGSNRHKYAFDEVRRKIEGYKNARMIQATSMEAVRDIEWNYLDMAYVDANHLFDYCVQDLIEWSKRVRSGGIVSGDDYYQLDQKRWVGGGVVEAVQAYTNAHRIPIWYIFQGHKSTDYLWVRP